MNNWQENNTSKGENLILANQIPLILRNRFKDDKQYGTHQHVPNLTCFFYVMLTPLHYEECVFSCPNLESPCKSAEHGEKWSP